MSTKEALPQLAGVRLKTRKRNIVVKHDPQSFSDAVIDILQEDREENPDSLEKALDASAKELESSELDFSRYGDVLFEVAFAGARLTTGGNVASEGKRLDFNILACPADREAIVPIIKWFQTLIRRRPFLVKSLESTLIKLLLSLEFYDEEGRKKLAIALARCLALKVGVLPERVLPNLLEDRLVAKGTVLSFVTDFFSDYLATETVDSLLDELRKSKLDSRLLELFPQQKRSWAEFDSHFEAAGLEDLVEHNKKKRHENYCSELATMVREAAVEEPAKKADVLTAEVKAKKEEWGLSDGEVLKAVFNGLVSSVIDTASSKNTQQIQFSVLKAAKAYSKTLATFATSARLEALMLQNMQVICYEDSRLLKLFPNIVKVLYDADVLGEDSIKYWYTKGSSPKGRNVFLKDMEPFMTWLDEAEEDEDDEE